jgi:hypothetical protein
MSWASRRQSTYLLGVFTFCALILLAILYPRLTQAPTCFDGKKNGTETGVDCGGGCARVCNAAVSEPLVIWKRAFNVSGSNYNLVALVENTNKNAGIKSINYEFRIYDTNNLLIGRRQGSTFVPPNQQFAVFEPRFDAGESEIKSVTFEFIAPFVWVTKAPTLQALPVRVDNIVQGDDKSNPSVTARINNDSIYDLPPFDVITILYDQDRNAITASKTHKEGLASNSSASLLFTWPQPLLEDPASRDILVQINPFTTSF